MMDINSEDTGAILDAMNDQPDDQRTSSTHSKPSNSKRNRPKVNSQVHSTSKGSADMLSDFPSHSASAVLLIDDNEEIQFKDSRSFSKSLNCKSETNVKVISIVGKTGDGKSHTLNHAFYNGEKIFITSNNQNACTVGVWASYVPDQDYLLLDTEGLLGNASNPNRQKRLLLKLFAISDVVIYRTMAERLHSDIFSFLSDASDAFSQHFKSELDRIVTKNGLRTSTSEMGPAVIIFQETKHTETIPAPDRLISCKNQCTMDDFLNQQFNHMGRNVNSFSLLRHIGSKRLSGESTDFKPLVSLVKEIIKGNLQRSARRLDFVFKTLNELNRNFSSDLPSKDAFTFVEEYFTCPSRCICCQTRCSLGLGHISEGREHQIVGSYAGCVYEPSIENKQYYCKHCTAEGRETLLVPKFLETQDNAFTGVVRYLWSGFILECTRHGVVYRSRANWSNNPLPEKTPDVDWRVVHVWPGQQSLLKGTHPVGQIVIDGLTNMSTHLGKFAWPHAKKLGDYIADSVAPEYWTPNSFITNCNVCHRTFADDCDEPIDEPGCAPTESMSRKNDPAASIDQDDGFKHHCRACGQGVCSLCSTARMPVPERGYGSENVRVCDLCYNKSIGHESPVRGSANESPVHNSAITPYSQGSGVPPGSSDPNSSSLFGRKVIETIAATSDYIKPILQAPKDMVKTYARPDYWQPDEECTMCPCCDQPFGSRRPVHHCRECGKGVCNACSSMRKAIPWRGLDQPTRVCDSCSKMPLRKDNAPQPDSTTKAGSPEKSALSMNGTMPGIGVMRPDPERRPKHL